MATRTYGQHCGIARALDLVGERWTMLVLRELLLGPKRFKDLLDALPGVGTGLLTTRLRGLEAEGLIERRRLPPPAGSSVYVLTEAGRELEPVLAGLARFGARRLGAPRRGTAFQPQWAMLAMRWTHDPDAACGVDRVYDFAIGDQRFHVTVRDGDVQVHDGPGHRPAVTVRASPATFARIAARPEEIGTALASGRMQIEGAPDEVATLARIFAPARAAARMPA